MYDDILVVLDCIGREWPRLGTKIKARDNRLIRMDHSKNLLSGDLLCISQAYGFFSCDANSESPSGGHFLM